MSDEIYESRGDAQRTDDLDLELNAKGVLADRYSDMLDHARELEHELKEAIEEIARIVKRYRSYKDERDDLRAEVKRCFEDSHFIGGSEKIRKRLKSSHDPV